MSNYTSAAVPESSRVVIDPVTRIEGHLRVEMEAGDGVIKNAWTSTTQYRPGPDGGGRRGQHTSVLTVRLPEEKSVAVAADKKYVSRIS